MQMICKLIKSPIFPLSFAVGFFVVGLLVSPENREPLWYLAGAALFWGFIDILGAVFGRGNVE